MLNSSVFPQSFHSEGWRSLNKTNSFIQLPFPGVCMSHHQEVEQTTDCHLGIRKERCSGSVCFKGCFGLKTSDLITLTWFPYGQKCLQRPQWLRRYVIPHFFFWSGKKFCPNFKTLLLSSHKCHLCTQLSLLTCNIVYINFFSSVLVYGVCVCVFLCVWMWVNTWHRMHDVAVRGQPQVPVFTFKFVRDKVSFVHYWVCQDNWHGSFQSFLSPPTSLWGHWGYRYPLSCLVFKRALRILTQARLSWQMLYPAPIHRLIYFEYELFLGSDPEKLSFWF